MNDLARYHNDTVRALHADEDNRHFEQAAADRYDAVSDLAITLIVEAQAADDGEGYIGPAVPDKLDVPVSEDVQTLLELAFFRYPALADYIEDLLQRPDPKDNS